MANKLTKYNHYNPCFWTAYWNLGYYTAAINTSNLINARKQLVYTLNLHSNTIFNTSVEKVFYQKNLGKAKITPESMKNFCMKYDPSSYTSFCQEIDKNPENLDFDFEDILTHIESVVYGPLIEIIRTGKLSSLEHKGLLTGVLIIHAMRSYEMMTSMLDIAPELGMDKWEYFVFLKNSWSNPLILERAVGPPALGQWTFYQTKEHIFPLSDSPVMINNNNLMATLSPRLLLEINLDDFNHANELGIFRDLSTSKFQEFQRITIANSFRDIIFYDSSELEKWRTLPEFVKRVSIVDNALKQKQAIHEAARRIIWAINGFGRVPYNFETWANTGSLFKN
ncbi:MAG: hypothetical protein ACYDG5_01645 [Dehalococcoidales bacterium]